VISRTNTLAYSTGMGLLWNARLGIVTPIAISYVLFPTMPMGM
jgi:hypothetical protein